MFRPMRRFKQQLTDEECIEILKSLPRGILSLIGDDGYPYGLPISYWYDPDSGHIFFHGAKEGHKTDSIIKCNKASFCVCDEGYRKQGEWALNIKSVIVFGKIEFVSDREKMINIAENLCLKFTDDREYIENEISGALDRVLCLELVPEHMTGKLVCEA